MGLQVSGNDLKAHGISAATGTAVVIPAAPGIVYRVYKLFLATSDACVVTFQTTTGSPIHGIGPVTFVAAGGLVLDFDTRAWLTTGLGEGLRLNITGAGTVSGCVYALSYNR